MLSSWGVAFDAIDVEAMPSAKAELARLGVPQVPAVVVGERAVHGWNPRAVAELVGVHYREAPRLPVGELGQRLDRILAVAGRMLATTRREHLTLSHPGRDRDLRQLGYHTFRLSLAFPDAMRERRLPQDWLNELAPPALADGPALAGYGETVRVTLREWLARPGAAVGEVETYYGRQSGHELLERTTWHAAQHVRQIAALLDGARARVDERLTVADLEGLPLPAEVW